MATPYMILQMVLFLIHAIQELNYKNNAMDLLYQFTNIAKNWFKKAKTAKLGYMS